MKIIVVDDEIAALKAFLPGVVDEISVECRMFSNPRTALEYCRQNRVDAAFLDIVMPEITGVELAERLIAVCPGVRVVFISAYTQDEEAIAARLGAQLVGFCYKPYTREKLVSLLAAVRRTAASPKLEIRMFDSFDLFVDGVAVNFSSRKAKELLALLADANGSYVTMDTAIGNLWADKNAEFGKRLYRDAVYRLRMTLKDVGAEGLVTFGRGRAVINTQLATCDMWTFLKEGGVFSGRYLPQYDWSIVTESALDQRRKRESTD